MKRTGLLQNYYVKEYNELTREEIQEIDKQVNDPEYMSRMSEEDKRSHPDFIKVKNELLAQQPMRHKLIQEYWDKNKNSEKGRKAILELAESTEEFPRSILQDEYIHFRDAIPEIDEFLEELKVSRFEEMSHQQKIELSDIKLKFGHLDTGFNPFDGKQPRRERIGEIKKEFKN